MDEVVNRFGFSGIVSLLSLQARIVFTRKPCRRPTCLRVFTTLLWLPEFTALRPRNPACNAELLCWAKDGAQPVDRLVWLLGSVHSGTCSILIVLGGKAKKD